MHSEKRDDISIYINPKHDSKCEWRRVNANQRIPIVVTILERSSFSASLVRMRWTKKIHLWSKTKTDSWWHITERISKTSAGKENVNPHKACLTKQTSCSWFCTNKIAESQIDESTPMPIELTTSVTRCLQQRLHICDQ